MRSGFTGRSCWPESDSGSPDVWKGAGGGARRIAMPHLNLGNHAQKFLRKDEVSPEPERDDFGCTRLTMLVVAQKVDLKSVLAKSGVWVRLPSSAPSKMPIVLGNSLGFSNSIDCERSRTKTHENTAYLPSIRQVNPNCLRLRPPSLTMSGATTETATFIHH